MTQPQVTPLESSELKQRILRFQQVESDIVKQVRRVIDTLNFFQMIPVFPSLQAAQTSLKSVPLTGAAVKGIR